MSATIPELPPQRTSSEFSNRLLNVWLGNILVDDANASQPLRFSLWELLAAMTGAAILLALFRALGLAGAAVSFGAALLLTLAIYPNWATIQRQEAMFDFVWGALMPVVCLTFDPFVFKFDEPVMMSPGVRAKPFETAQVYPWSLPVYLVIACQIVALSVWLVCGRLPAAISAVWAGMLWSGFALAAVVGVALLLPAAMGSLVAIGALGFTPLFTARAFYRRALQAGAVATRQVPSTKAGWLAVAGYWLGLVVPGAIGGLLAVWLFSRGLLDWPTLP